MSVPFSALTVQTTLPQAIIDRQSDVTLRTHVLALFAAVNPTFDISEGSDAWALLSPFAIVLSEMYADLVQVELSTSLAFATGRSLDMLGELYGVARGPAAYANGTVTVVGVPGAVIPSGTTFSTRGAPAQFFVYLGTQALTIPPAGRVDVPVRAVSTGAAGNVPAGSIQLFGTPVPLGLQSVLNSATFTGGADLQPDGPVGQFLTGYRSDIWRLMDARGEGGAAKHYRAWARSVPGVGGVVVLETTPRPGWVTVALLGNDGLPADGDVVQAVESFILDPWRLTFEAEDLPNSAATPSSQPDGTPPPPAYNTLELGAGGSVSHLEMEQVLPQPGIWRLKPRLKGHGTVEFGMWNNSTETWATQRPLNQGDPALQTIQLDDDAFIHPALDVWQDFGWNGGPDRVEARISCTAGTVYIDQVAYWATMSRADRDVGLAPAGARVLVKPADAVTVNISATLSYALQQGQTQTQVQTAIHQNLVEYLRGQAFATDPNIRRAAIENAIFSTPGVSDVQDVQLNGAAANIAIAPDAVAVLGTTTWS